MKKTKIFVLALALVIGLSACGTPAPEEAVAQTLDALKSADEAQIEKYMNYDELTASMGSVPKAASDVVTTLLKNIDYEILSASTEGDSATVETKISNIDMGQVMQAFFEDLMTFAMENIDETQNMSPEETQAKAAEFLNAAVEKYKDTRAENTVSVKLSKQGGKWEVTQDEAFTDAVFGGIITAAKKIGSSME